MLEVHQRIGVEHQGTVDATVVLDHEQRERGRLLLRSENDEEIRLFLKRGKALIVGEYLQAKCGRVIQIIGATEAVAQASCDDWPTFARACYHLGNRHVKIFVGDRQLHIKPDHVLEEMLLLMGLKIEHKQQVFIPESGAYKHAH